MANSRPSIEAGDLPLHELSNQPTGASLFSNSVQSDTPDGHSERMKEFMNRPATPPPFPEDLPSRPSQKKPLNKWMLITVVLLLALLGTVTPLAVLLGLAQHKANAPQSLPDVAAQAPVTRTVTTMVHTTTLTLNNTITASEIETFTFPAISYVTVTITAPPPQSTGIVSDPEICRNNNDPLILGRSFCVMAKECNMASVDVKMNDCRGFCEAAGCSRKGRLLEVLTPMVRGCCEHCACFLEPPTMG